MQNRRACKFFYVFPQFDVDSCNVIIITEVHFFNFLLSCGEISSQRAFHFDENEGSREVMRLGHLRTKIDKTLQNYHADMSKAYHAALNELT